MKPRLTENPKDWLKFTAAIWIVVRLVIAALTGRGTIHREVMCLLLLVPFGAFLVGLVRPRWFRGFYRGGMTLSFWLGQVMSRVLLTVLFLLVVTPLGLIVRLLAKHLLHLKHNQSSQSY